MNKRYTVRQSKEFSDKRIRLIKDIDAMYSHIYDMYERIDRIQQGIIDHININAKLDPVRDANRVRRNTRYIEAAVDELREYTTGLHDEKNILDKLIHDLDSITSDYRSYHDKMIDDKSVSMDRDAKEIERRLFM
ncbi:hypothetical protein KAW18_11655 [candidate division WOR-3 bacterium]|nr:hypothetical protein [candidate division WOR-3 bacterium]